MEFQLIHFTIACLCFLYPPACFARIGCFMCSSRNGSNTDCEDPFNATESSYVDTCKVPKRNRGGEFPAHFCVKLIGKSYETGEDITIRRCVLEPMDKSCGYFKVADEKFKGCILTCSTDGCNKASLTTPVTSSLILFSITSLLFMTIKH